VTEISTHVCMVFIFLDTSFSIKILRESRGQTSLPVQSSESPGVNFINILCALFLPIFWHLNISNPKQNFVIFGAKILYKKCTRKKLMKLTAVVSTDSIATSAIQRRRAMLRRQAKVADDADASTKL